MISNTLNPAHSFFTWITLLPWMAVLGSVIKPVSFSSHVFFLLHIHNQAQFRCSTPSKMFVLFSMCALALPPLIAVLLFQLLLFGFPILPRAAISIYRKKRRRRKRKWVKNTIVGYRTVTTRTLDFMKSSAASRTELNTPDLPYTYLNVKKSHAKTLEIETKIGTHITRGREKVAVVHMKRANVTIHNRSTLPPHPATSAAALREGC